MILYFIIFGIPYFTVGFFLMLYSIRIDGPGKIDDYLATMLLWPKWIFSYIVSPPRNDQIGKVLTKFSEALFGESEKDE